MPSIPRCFSFKRVMPIWVPHPTAFTESILNRQPNSVSRTNRFLNFFVTSGAQSAGHAKAALITSSFFYFMRFFFHFFCVFKCKKQWKTALRAFPTRPGEVLTWRCRTIIYKFWRNRTTKQVSSDLFTQSVRPLACWCLYGFGSTGCNRFLTKLFSSMTSSLAVHFSPTRKCSKIRER